MSNPLLLVPVCLKSYNFDLNLNLKLNSDHEEYPELVITGLTKDALQETKDMILENQFNAFKYKKLVDEIREHISDYEHTGGSSVSTKDLKRIMASYL